MKLFHTEDGKEVVYVQRHDMMYINSEMDIPIPASVFLKFFNGITIVDDSNRFEFVKFEGEEAVNYFKELEFIIDFDHYKGFTDEQIDKEAEELAAKANEIAEKWNAMTKKKRKENISLREEYNKIGYMIQFLYVILSVKNKKREMPFPEFVEIPECSPENKDVK